MRLSKTIGLILIINLYINTANAVIVNNNTYTTDTDSGLDWLDVTTSVNQSYNYVSSRFGLEQEYDGWRYATSNEFNQLINNATGAKINGFRSIYFTGFEIVPLIDLLGSTYDTERAATNLPNDGRFDYTSGFVADIDDFGLHYSAYMQHDARSITNFDFALARVLPRNGTFRSYDKGSYLVRNSVVPLPATFWLFGSGFLGLIGVFNRKN